LNSNHHAVVRITCPDRPGIVSDVSGLLFKLGLNIHHADQHLDAEANLFFQRIEFPVPEDWERVHAELTKSLDDLGMRHSVRMLSERLRVGVLISKHPHCGLDILDRHRTGEIQCDVAVVISNHPDLGPEISRRGYTFVHEPIAGNKAEQERHILARLTQERVDLVILARYMQILTGNFVAAYPNRIINIHHAFLPAFPGARPYHAARARGVKIIGATSHYVTETLDAGPIIEQDVLRVTHRHSAKDLVRVGRDLEKVVLSRAIGSHLSRKVIVHKGRTIVFD
jgi:formyltetrahydrofolate deformylase